jgi:hypothetical protein
VDLDVRQVLGVVRGGGHLADPGLRLHPRRVGKDRQRLYGRCGPADQALTAELVGYTHNQRHDLDAAESDLRREVKTESAFDDQIEDFTFPNAANAIGEALLEADQKRVKLLTLQAGSASLRQLQSFDSGDQAADAAVAAQVRVIRQDLGLSPVTAQHY